MLALRQQLNVLQRSVKRPKLTAADRFLWARLSPFWTGWRSALVIVKPDTVIAWHRKGSGWSGPGRCAAASRDDRQSPLNTELIRLMSRENPLWGAPRIHGEVAPG